MVLASIVLLRIGIVSSQVVGSFRVDIEACWAGLSCDFLTTTRLNLGPTLRMERSQDRRLRSARRMAGHRMVGRAEPGHRVERRRCLSFFAGR